MAMTKEQRAARRQAAAESKARIEKAHAEAREILKTGKCPRCGRSLRRNLALSGWWQCSQLGAEGFRADASQPSCDFQMFTE